MRLRFFGQSAWGFEAAGARLLIDPYPISDEARTLLVDYADASLTHVLVTHAGFDHLGIAFELLDHAPAARLVADIAVARETGRLGVAGERVLIMGWNMLRSQGGWHIRALEAKHASVLESDDGYVTGMPLGFLVWHESEPEVRVFHLGDTSIFSDLALFGQLYRPLVAIINVCGAMNAREAALATLWTGADVALPVHFTRQPEAAQEFCTAVASLPREVAAWVPEVGATYAVERTTSISR